MSQRLPARTSTRLSRWAPGRADAAQPRGALSLPSSTRHSLRVARATWRAACRVPLAPPPAAPGQALVATSAAQAASERNTARTSAGRTTAARLAYATAAPAAAAAQRCLAAERHHRGNVTEQMLVATRAAGARAAAGRALLLGLCPPPCACYSLQPARRGSSPPLQRYVLGVCVVSTELIRLCGDCVSCVSLAAHLECRLGLPVSLLACLGEHVGDRATGVDGDAR